MRRALRQNVVDLEKMLANLVRHEVEFVIIDGVAATAHGSAYVTYDLDFCYRRDAANLQKLVAALGPLNPELRDAPQNLPFFWDLKTLQRGMNFTLKTDWGDVDLLGEVAGVGTFAEVWAASIQVELFGLPCAVISLAGLIAAKRAAGRPKDQLLLPELEALHEALEDGEDTAQ